MTPQLQGNSTDPITVSDDTVVTEKTPGSINYFDRTIEDYYKSDLKLPDPADSW